jgi:hypothetical protein
LGASPGPLWKGATLYDVKQAKAVRKVAEDEACLCAT